MRRLVADGRGSLVESTVMTSTSARVVVFLLLVASIGLLIPGLFAPVLTIRGVLTRDGIAQIAPTMLQNGLSDETMAVLKSVMNPTIVAFIEGTGGDLRKNILDKLTPQVTASLQKNVGEVEVYQQTRSIVGSVRRLYEVGSPVPATLILLFSVIVPLFKAALVTWAVFLTGSAPAADTPIRRDDCQVVDGRRLRCRAVHRVSRRTSERDADPGAERQSCAHRLLRAVRRRFLLVRGLLPVLAGLATDHGAAGGHVDGAGYFRFVNVIFKTCIS